MDAEQFKKDLTSVFPAEIYERTLVVKEGVKLGGDTKPATIFVNFYNLPSAIVEKKLGGGAEAENNRMCFSVKPGADGKVKIEMLVSALPRQYRLRARTASQYLIAKYLADFLRTVTRETFPNYTHSKIDSAFPAK